MAEMKWELRSEWLSRELVVLRVIEMRKPTFRELIQYCETNDLASEEEVSIAVDVLFDQGMVRAEPIKDQTGIAKRLYVAGEAEDFVQALIKLEPQS